MKNNHKLFWIDGKYKDDKNKETRDMIENELKKKYNFNYTPFLDLDKAIEEIKKIKFETIFVLVSGRYYQDYYEKMKNSRRELNCNVVCLIYTSTIFKDVLEKRLKDDNLKEETYDSIGNKFYNWGGVADSPKGIKTFLGKYLNIRELIDTPDYSVKDTISEFTFEPINKYDDLIISSIYQKSHIYENSISEEEASKFNNKLSEIISKDISYFNNMELQEQTKNWISLYTGEDNFYKDMYKEFMNNNFLNYNTFSKALYQGIEQGYLKSEFNVPLYFGSFLYISDYNFICNNLKKKKKELNGILVYSKKIMYSTKDIKTSLIFAESKIDKNNKYIIPVIFEITGLKQYNELLSNNIDISIFSQFPDEKEVDFMNYSCFLIEEDGIKEKTIDNKNIIVIKLNYLGKYLDKINQKIEVLNEIEVDKLLNNKSSKFAEDIKEKYKKNEGKNDEDMHGLIKKLLKGSKLLSNKNQFQANKKNKIENIIEIKLKNLGKYMDDEYFDRYKWSFDVYYDDVLQNEPSNEIRNFIPKNIKIKFKYIIIDIEGMFMDCSNITEINFINFNINAITSMAYMFSNCDNLTKVNFNNFLTRNVISMK